MGALRPGLWLSFERGRHRFPGIGVNPRAGILNGQHPPFWIVRLAVAPAHRDSSVARELDRVQYQILGDAADYDIYRGSSASRGVSDLTDLVLHARIVGVLGSCREGDEKNRLAVTVGVAVELNRGPAMQGREAEVPVFVAVTEGETILDKRTVRMPVVFPSNVDRVTLTSGENLLLPVTATKSGAAYTILAGFQLTPDQMTQTRRRTP